LWVYHEKKVVEVCILAKTTRILEVGTVIDSEYNCESRYNEGNKKYATQEAGRGKIRHGGLTNIFQVEAFSPGGVKEVRS
jgi:hypothetical protein